MKKYLAALLVLTIVLICLPPASGQAGRAPGTQAPPPGLTSKIPVFVSIIPQAAFVERIGGRHVDVEVLIGEGQSPHTYEPTPKQMARLTAAKAYFCIGVPVEKGVLRKIRPSHQRLLIVETQEGIPWRYLEGHHHNHGGGNEKNHRDAGKKEPDPHIWMAPQLVKIQARHIYQALVRLDGVHQREYVENLRAFEAELDRVDARISRSLAPLQGRRLYVFHPAFGYFADAYGLIQVPVEIEGKEPSARQLARLIRRAKKDGVRVMFVQSQFSAKSAESLAKAIGGAVVPLNPLARDYLDNLERMATAVEQGLR